VVSFVALASRALRPGGVLVVESVNPASLPALSGFFLDLTHVRPYAPQSIAHLLITSGFVDIDTRLLFPDTARDAVASVLENALGGGEGVPAIAADIADKLYGPHAYAVSGQRPAA